MKKQILKENEMNCKTEREFYVQCDESKEKCIKCVVDNELLSKSYNGGLREAIVRCFGLDGKEPWSLAQLAMYLRLPLDEVEHIYARALRVLRHPSHNKEIRKFDIWACKNPSSPYSKLIFSIFGIRDPDMYLIFREGVDEENEEESSENMTDEEYEKMKRVRRASYKYNHEVRSEGSKRIDFELAELEKGADIFSIFKAEDITLSETLEKEFKSISVKLDSNEITQLFQEAVQGSYDARNKIIEGSKLYALLVCKEYSLKPNFLLGFTTEELIKLAYQRLIWIVDVYVKTNKNTLDFKELIATHWIWEGFSKAVHARYSSIEPYVIVKRKQKRQV